MDTVITNWFDSDSTYESSLKMFLGGQFYLLLKLVCGL